MKRGFCPYNVSGPDVAASYDRRALVIAAWDMPIPTDKDIADVVAGLGSAASDAVASDFDGLTLHGAHDYLIVCFREAKMQSSRGTMGQKSG